MIDSQHLPFGAESILVTRMRKLAPELVVISLLPPRVRFDTGPYAFVRAIPSKTYDWRFLRKLEVLVVCNQEHARIGLIEKLCKEASRVTVWFLDESRGFTARYYPTAESVMLDDSRLWQWQLTLEPLMRFEEVEWTEWLAGAVKEVNYVQHHS